MQDIGAACARFVRDDAASGQVTGVIRTLINGGYQETAGDDLDVRYCLADTGFGNFDWKTTYVDCQECKRDNEAETPVEQRNGWAAATETPTSASVPT